MNEEGGIYLENYPTRPTATIGFFTLEGPIEGLKVFRVQEGAFHPKILFLLKAGLAGFFMRPLRHLRSRCKQPGKLRIFGGI